MYLYCVLILILLLSTQWCTQSDVICVSVKFQKSDWVEYQSGRRVSTPTDAVIMFSLWWSNTQWVTASTEVTEPDVTCRLRDFCSTCRTTLNMWSRSLHSSSHKPKFIFNISEPQLSQTLVWNVPQGRGAVWGNEGEDNHFTLMNVAKWLSKGKEQGIFFNILCMQCSQYVCVCVVSTVWQ